MKPLLLFLLLCASAWPTATFAEESLFFEGTLYKKAGQWRLFVESDHSAIRKGVINLIKIPKNQRKALLEKYFVQVRGKRENCNSPYICIAVESIKPGNYQPIQK